VIPEPYNPVWFFGSLFALVVAIIGVVGYVLYRAERARCRALRDIANQWGLSYTVRARRFLLDGGESLESFKLFSRRGSPGTYILLEGKVAGADAAVLDYRYYTRHGSLKHRHTRTHCYSALLLTYRGEPLPAFRLRPETSADMLIDWLGFDDIDFVEHLGFSAFCHLSGPDEGRIRHIFTPDAIQWIEQHHGGLHIEASGQRLLLYYANKLTATRAQRLLTLGPQLLQLLRFPASLA
jgi:hypothetical protein